MGVAHLLTDVSTLFRVSSSATLYGSRSCRSINSESQEMGTGRRLKVYNPDIQIIGVQPAYPYHGIEGLKHIELISLTLQALKAH